MNADFSFLKGKTIVKVEGLEKGSDCVIFKTGCGLICKMYHEQDCCESVEIDDVCGDVTDLVGSPILVAEENTSNDNPLDVTNDNPIYNEILEYQDSFTWTFYKLATRKGYVDIRWYGESNGYYSESVDFVIENISHVN